MITINENCGEDYDDEDSDDVQFGAAWVHIALPPYGPRVAQSPSDINESHHDERIELFEKLFAFNKK